MNQNNNNIDDLFRSGLDGYKKEPSAGVWRRIEGAFFGNSSGYENLIRGLAAFLILLSIGSLTVILNPSRNYHTASMLNAAQENDEIQLTSGIIPQPSEIYTAPENSITPQSESNQNSDNSNNPLLHQYTLASLNTEFEAQPAEKYPYTSITGETSHSSMRNPGYPFGRLNSSFILPGSSLYPSEQELREVPENDFFDIRLRNDYLKPANLGFGIHFTPGVTFYDPNPSNTNYALDATANYTIQRISVQAGVGLQKAYDIGTYELQYDTYDSIGYYLEVTSFRFSAENQDSLIFNYRETTVYDSVDHIQLTEKRNTYTYIYFPVYFGYKFYEKGRITLGLKAGIQYAMLIHSNEPTVDVEVSDVDNIRVVRMVPERTTNNWIVSAGLQFTYRLNDRMVFTLEPLYGQYLNSVYRNTPGWKSNNPYTIGIRAGVDFNFK